VAKNKVVRMEKKLEQLESGDTVKVSGFYVSNHLECKDADLWVRSEHQLPVCMHCGKSATFTLQKKMKHISEDPDFR
jgi:hypothetical protein